MIPRSVALFCLAVLASLPAWPAAPEPPMQPTEITSDHFESRSTDTEMFTLCTGSVTVTGTNIRIVCDRLEIVSLRFGEKDQVIAKKNKFKSLIAIGRVKITQGDREATCGRAVVLPGEDKITLTETPMVEDKGAGATWLGENLVLLRGERRVFGDKVRMILPPVKDLSFDKNKPLTPPPAGQPAAPEAK